MIGLGIGAGFVAGAAVAAVAINSLYPDVPKRMLRDGRRTVRQARRAINHIVG
jgi:hypothetical protein